MAIDKPKKRKSKFVKVLLQIPLADAERLRVAASKYGASLTAYIGALVKQYLADIAKEKDT